MEEEKKEVEEVEEVEQEKPTEEPEEKKKEIMTIEEVMVMLDFDGVYDDLTSEDKSLVDDVYARFNRVIVQ